MGEIKGKLLGKIKKITSLKIDNYIDTFNNKDNNADFDKHFNIIYGLNGSGKTSLSRLIGSFSTKYRDQDSNSNNSVNNQSITGSIVHDENKKISNSDLDEKFENIFIFNSDYIQNNIASSQQDGGKLQDDNDNSIILGEEEIKENEEIQKNKKEIEELNNELKNIIGCKEENIKGSLETKESTKREKYNIKNKIIENFQNSVTSDNPILNNHRFNRKDAQNFLDSKIEKPGTKLNENDIKEDKQKIKNLVNSEDFKIINNINIPEQVINNYEKLFEKLENILDSKKITSKEEIERFTNNPSLNRWARDIFDEIKNQKLSDSKCPICASEKIITDDKEVSSFKTFYDEKLNKYFNEEKNDFSKKCKDLKDNFKNNLSLDSIVNSIPKDTKFLSSSDTDQYKQYRDSIIDYTITSIKELCNGKVIEIIEKKEDSCVKNDENYTNDYENLSTEFNNNFKAVKELINNINKLINTNNTELTNGDNRKKEFEKNIKKYYYFEYKEKYDGAVNEFNNAETELVQEKEKQTNINNEINKKDQKKKEIEEELKKLKIKDKKDNLVGMMKEYVKKTQLNINIEYDNEKIILKRDNNTIPLHKLSEGEKNLLLFTYFIVRIKIYTEDKEGDKAKKAIVVIDDPHSSLDENYVDSIYTLIEKLAFKTKEDKKEYKNNIQVFLLSHNSYFLCKINTSIFRNSKLKKTTFEIFKNAILKTITLNKKDNRFQNLGVDYINKYNTLCEVSKLEASDNSNLIGSAKPREFLEEMQTYLLPSYKRLNIQDDILKYINIKQDIHTSEHYNGLDASRKIEIVQSIFNDLKNIDIDEGTDEEKKVKSYIQQHINLLDKAIGNNNN